jgi:hypothetical protein
MVDRGAGWVYEQIEAPEGDTGYTPKEKLKDRKARYAEQIRDYVNNAVGGTVTLASLMTHLRASPCDQNEVKSAAGSLVDLGILEADKRASEATWKIKRSAHDRAHLASGAMPDTAPRSNVLQFPPPHTVMAPQVNHLPAGTVSAPPVLPNVQAFAPQPGGGFTTTQPAPLTTSTLDADPLVAFLTRQKLRCAQGGGSFTLTEAVIAQGSDPRDATARAHVSKAIRADGFFDGKNAPRGRGGARETEFRQK